MRPVIAFVAIISAAGLWKIAVDDYVAQLWFVGVLFTLLGAAVILGLAITLDSSNSS